MVDTLNNIEHNNSKLKSSFKITIVLKGISRVVEGEREWNS